MNGQTLADVFKEADFRRHSGQLINPEAIEETAKLAAAESVDNTRQFVESLVARTTDRLLDVDLMEIMVGAWAKIAELAQYAEGEKLHSNKTHKYVLSKHKIGSRHSPKIELYVRDQKITEIVVDIDLTLLMAKTTLKIRQGRIMEVQISGCQVTGTVSCYGQTLFEQESKEIDFPSTVKLGKGIEIPPPLKIKFSDQNPAPG